MKILFATKNNAKVKRFYSKLLENNIEIISLNDMNFNIDVEEMEKMQLKMH